MNDKRIARATAVAMTTALIYLSVVAAAGCGLWYAAYGDHRSAVEIAREEHAANMKRIRDMMP